MRFSKQAAIFLILLGLYLLIYRGIPLSGDELALFSAAESLVKHGNTNLYSTYYQYPGFIWSSGVQEPLQSVLSMPLYWAALQIPDIGMLQTVWLFNALATALIGALLYSSGRRLGYSERTSLITALLICTTTMLLPYTQTYFAEPMTAFWLLVMVWCGLHLRDQWRWYWLIGLVIAIIAGIQTKESTLLTVPAMLFLVWSDRLSRQQKTLLIVSAVVVVVSMLLLNTDEYGERVSSTSIRYFLTVQGAYLLSPGRSLWMTNPILIASLVGSWMLWWRDWRLALMPWLLLLSYSIGYGMLGWDWHGGLAWGTRYLLPIVPVIGLLLLPLVDRFARWSRLWQVTFVLLILWSALIQWLGVLVPTQTFFDVMGARFPGDSVAAFYDQGTWQIQHTPWVIALQELAWDRIPLVWWRVGGLAGVMAALLMMAWGMVSLRVSRLVWGLPILSVVGCGVVLASIQHDPHLKADREALWQAVELANAQADAADILLLTSPEYRDFFMNNYTGQAPLVILPYAPGERYSPTDPLKNPDLNINERLDGRITRVIASLNQNYDDVWVVAESGPFIDYAYRAVEAQLNRLYYFVNHWDFDPAVRVLRYEPFANAYLPRFVLPQPIITFGERLRLVGYDMPQSAVAGQVLPLDLLWQPTQPIDFDYNIGVFLVNQDGVLVGERNGQPQGTFGYMTRWEGLQIDANGIPLATDLPPGDYQVQVVVYDWRDGRRLAVRQNDNFVEGDFALLGTVNVLAPDSQIPVAPLPTAEDVPLLDSPIRFEQGVSMIGLRVPEVVSQGDWLTIEATWQVDQPLDKRYYPAFGLDERFYTNAHPLDLYHGTLTPGTVSTRYQLYVTPLLAPGQYTLDLSIRAWADDGAILPMLDSDRLPVIEVIAP